MLELTNPRRAMRVDKVPDIANLAIAALFFGQFLDNRAFSPGLALFGIGVWMFLIGCAYVLAGGNQP